MKIEYITNLNHDMFEKAMNLYKNSFPEFEQRELFSQKKILSDKEYHFGLIYDENVFSGLVLYWETDKFIYIEHLCIVPELRGKNYGTNALSLVCKMNKTVILEIDPPVDTVSEKRLHLYKKCGFVKNDFKHIHPPYHRGNYGHSLVIMTYPQQITQNEYDCFNKYLEEKIMKNAFNS